jgi:hypothetical protein
MRNLTHLIKLVRLRLSILIFLVRHNPSTTHNIKVDNFLRDELYTKLKDKNLIVLFV